MTEGRTYFPNSHSKLFGTVMCIDIPFRRDYIEYEDGRFKVYQSARPFGDGLIGQAYTDEITIYDDDGLFFIEYTADGIDIVDNCVCFCCSEETRKHLNVIEEEHEWDIHNRISLRDYQDIIDKKATLGHCDTCGSVIVLYPNHPAHTDDGRVLCCVCYINEYED